MGLRVGYGPWWPDSDFICPRCKEKCDGENNSMVLSGNLEIIRWCGCGYQEIRRKDSLSHINTSVSLLNLCPPAYPKFFPNPEVARSYGR